MKKVSQGISIISLLTSLMIFFFIVYRAENYDVGYLYYKKYFIISFVLIFLSILSFYFNDNFKINLSLLLFFLILPLYCFESILSFKEWNERVGDKRTLEKFYKDALKEEKNILPAIPPSVHANRRNNENILPLSLVSNYGVFNCNENGEFVVNKTDRFGFNTDNATWNKKNIDFILVGDSGTYGFCEERKNNIDGHIKKNSEFKNIINFGMGGNGPLINYATLREYYPKDKNVKNILWIFHPNDLGNLNSEFSNEILKKYLNDEFFSQDLIQKDDLKNKINQNLIFKRLMIKKFPFLLLKKTRKFISDFKQNKSSSGYSSDNRYYNDKNLLIFKKIMELALKIDKNAKFYFVYLVEYQQFFTDNYNFDHKQKILEIVKQLNIPIIDLESSFKESKNQHLLFSIHPKFKHYSSDGYRLAAKHILSSLIVD